MKILVVDDNDDSRTYLERGLGSQGHNVRTACNGSDALKIAESWNPDLIITDIMMPEMDGFELCRKIREDALLFGVPIIVYTATYVDARDEKLAFALGASRFIIKPMGLSDIIGIINDVMEETESQQLPETANAVEDKQKIEEEYHKALARKLDKKVRELEEEHRTLKVSDEKFRAIGFSANDAIIMIDNDGCVSFWNAAAERIFGYSEEEVFGKKLSKIVIPKEFHTTHMNGFERFKNTGQGALIGKTVELIAINKDGKEFPIEHSLAAVKIKGKWNAIGTIRDITKRKQAEAQIQQGLDKLKITLDGVINALALTVELRDPYTSGHQQRVGSLACAIAGEMGLANDQIEGIGMAGIVHDIGKMHVPSEILSRPGKLTENEFDIVKTHSQAGYDILKGIEFPWPVANIVHQHHEYMDGSGYPSGLSNGDILLEARILCVADVVEAMSSHRPYRPALGIDKALEEISKYKGVRFDSDVVNACIKIIKEKGFEFDIRPGVM